MNTGLHGGGVGEFNRLQSWIIAPRAPNLPAVQHIAFGFLFTGCTDVAETSVFVVAVLSCRLCCRQRLGYRLDVVLNLFWDGSLNRYFSPEVGVRAYRRALPLFLGLVFGQFLAGSLWSLLGVVLNMNMYTLFP